MGCHNWILISTTEQTHNAIMDISIIMVNDWYPLCFVDGYYIGISLKWIKARTFFCQGNYCVYCWDGRNIMYILSMYTVALLIYCCFENKVFLTPESNHPRFDGLRSRLFGRRSKEISELRLTGLCVENSPVTGEFPAQRASITSNWFHLMTSSRLYIETVSKLGL